MIILGITGGIGSGKSIVCRVFEQLGVATYEADAEAKQLYVSNDLLAKKLQEKFPAELFSRQGKPDLKKFATYFFDDKKALEELNKLVHPIVLDHFQSWVKRHKDEPYVVKEAAILFESGSYKDCDRVVNVSAPVELRIKRVMERDKRSRSEVEKIISKQWTDEERNAKADFILVNDEATLLLPQILQVHKQLLKLAKEGK